MSDPGVWLLPNGTVALERNVSWMNVDPFGTFWHEPEQRHATHIELLDSLPEGARRMVELTPVGQIQRGEAGDIMVDCGDDGVELVAHSGSTRDSIDWMRGHVEISRRLLANDLALLDFLEAEEAAEDAADVAVLEQRFAEDTGIRYSLDEVLQEFGIREDTTTAERGGPELGQPEVLDLGFPVTPELLESCADWLDKHQGIGQPPHCGGADILRVEANRLYELRAERAAVEQHREWEAAQACERVLADLEPGVYDYKRPATEYESLDDGVAVVTADGRLLHWRTGFRSVINYTMRYPEDGYRYELRFAGDLSEVVTGE